MAPITIQNRLASLVPPLTGQGLGLPKLYPQLLAQGTYRASAQEMF